MGRSTFSSDDIVIKSPNDKRLYRLIELENGLTALLIHDPEIYPQGPPSCEEDEAAKLKTKENGGAASESETKKVKCIIYLIEHQNVIKLLTQLGYMR